MAFGITTYRANGTIMMDGLSKGGVFIEILNMPNGQSGSKSYSRTTANSLFYYVSSPGGHKVTIDTDASGFGRINWTATDSVTVAGTTVFVFASRLTTADQYGIMVVNDAGETLADHGYPAPQWVATLNLQAQAVSNWSTPEGYTCYLHTSDNFDLRPGSDKVVLLAMPDTGANDTWYAMLGSTIAAGAGTTNVTVRIYTKAATYNLPTLHVYSINNPQPSSENWGLRVMDQVGTITYDSSAECISVKDSLNVSYPEPGATTTYTMSYSTLPALSLPPYYRNVQGPPLTSRYVGGAKRVGNQLTLRLMLDYQTSGATVTTASYELGSQINRYCPVVDVSQLNAATPPGTPGGANWAAPVFTVQPANTTVKPGVLATLSAFAEGTPTPTYQWYRNGAAISGATGTSYSITPTLADDGAQFTCAANNSRADVVSNVAVLTVTNNEAPVITAKTGDLTVNSGMQVTINFTATGTPTPTCQVFLDGPTPTLVSSLNSYTFTATSTATYLLRATNNFAGNAHIAEARVVVTVTVPPTFSTNPSSQSVTAGGTVTFSVVASGGQPISYQWYRNNTSSPISGATSVNYTRTCSLADNGSTYFCIASNAYGSATSSSATLTVTQAPTAPTFAVSPTAADADSGGSTTLSAAANGYPAPTYAWTINGTSVGSGSSLTVSNVLLAWDKTTVTCTISNSQGSTSSSTTIRVFGPIGASVSPSSASRLAGQSVTFTGTPTGNYPMADGWVKPGGLGASGSSITVVAGASTAGTYTYTAFYVDRQNKAASATGTLTLTSAPTYPVFSTQPTSTTVTAGQSATFSCAASPVTGYQWYKNGAAVSGATSSSISTGATTTSNNGDSYYCVASNSSSQTQSSSATLTVNAPAQVPYTSYSNVSKTVTVYDQSVEIDVFSDGRVSVNGSSAGSWVAVAGSGSGSLYTIAAGGNFSPAFGSFALSTTYSFATYDGVSWLTPDGVYDGVNRTYTLSASVRLNGTTVAVISVTVNCRSNVGGA